MSQMVLLLDLIIEKVAQVSWTNHTNSNSKQTWISFNTRFKIAPLTKIDITVEVHLLYQRGKLSLAIV